MHLHNYKWQSFFYYWQFLQFLQRFQELFVSPSHLSLLVRNVNSNPLILDLMYLFLKCGCSVLVYQQHHLIYFFFPNKVHFSVCHREMC